MQLASACGAAQPSRARSQTPVRLPEPRRTLEVVARLSTGGMGEVYLVRRRGAAGVHKMYALKRVIPDVRKHDPYIERMFLGEAQLSALMQHPNVCEVMDVGHAAGFFYILMEYLDGLSVSRLVAKRRQCLRLADLRFIAGIGIQACEALHYVHGLRGEDGAPLGLVHRDVSPGNLYITRHGDVKLLDFGVAKARSFFEETRNGVVKGKFRYMAPEQLQRRPVDHRADVFALGIVLWELVTGRSLYKRLTAADMLDAVRRAEIPDIESIRPDVSAGFARAIHVALARDPDDRYSNAREFHVALVRATVDLGGPHNRYEVGHAIGSVLAPGARHPQIAQPRQRFIAAGTETDCSVDIDFGGTIAEEIDDEGPGTESYARIFRRPA